MGLFSKMFKGPQVDMEKSNENARKMRVLFNDAVENGDNYRIIFGYMEKCEIMKHVLEEAGTALTTRDIGVRTYGRSQGPPDYAHFASCTQIWAKTFSCMEYMMGEGFIERSERDGIIYWKAL